MANAQMAISELKGPKVLSGLVFFAHGQKLRKIAKHHSRRIFSPNTGKNPNLTKFNEKAENFIACTFLSCRALAPTFDHLP